MNYTKKLILITLLLFNESPLFAMITSEENFIQKNSSIASNGHVQKLRTTIEKLNNSLEVTESLQTSTTGSILAIGYENPPLGTDIKEVTWSHFLQNYQGINGMDCLVCRFNKNE